MKRLSRILGYLAESAIVAIGLLTIGRAELNTAILVGIAFMIADIGSGIAGEFDKRA
jgi:hypothetical protein